VSRTPASFVERAIRTLRDGISVRLEALHLPKKDWWKMIAPVVHQYNNEPHTTTGVKPDDAAKLDWDSPGEREKIIEIRSSIEGKAHHNRTYPLISVGDRVKVLRKPGKYGEFKSDFVAWSPQTFLVQSIAYEAGSPVFHLEGRVRPLRLHEILKVDAVQKAPRKKVVGKQGDAARLGTGRKPAEAAAVARSSAEARQPSVAASSSEPWQPGASASPVRVVHTAPSGGAVADEAGQARRIRHRSKTYDPAFHRLHPLGALITN
jgi:hypothetical protein